MDRRGFLKVLGVGGALVAAAPKLILPPTRNVVAEPARTIFLPPNGGWDIPALRQRWEAQWRGPAQQWVLDLDACEIPADWMDFNGPPRTINIGGTNGWVDSIAWHSWQPWQQVRIKGGGKLPDLGVIKAQLAVRRIDMTIRQEPLLHWLGDA